jgi:hypothetical protein
MTRHWDPAEPQALTGSDYPEEDGGVVIVAGDDFGAAILPGSVAKLAGPKRRAAIELQRTVRQIMELQSVMFELVGSLRAQGVSWGAIGFLVGTSPQAARERFSDEGESE